MKNKSRESLKAAVAVHPTVSVIKFYDKSGAQGVECRIQNGVELYISGLGYWHTLYTDKRAHA